MTTTESDMAGPAPQSTMLGAVSPEATAPPATDPAPGAGADAEQSPQPNKPDPKLCGVCGTQPGKYKCPRCSMPYCSVACSKQHKENHPPDPPKPERPSSDASNTNKTNPPAEEDPYSILLEHREAFQRLFAKYPSLPSALTRIQEVTLPPSDNNASTSSFSSIPGLGTVAANASRNRTQPWTKDVGLRKGAEALRRARTDPSDTGDGVREFCDLVRFLLSKREEKGRELVRRVREEVTAEETRVIERLLKEERG
ncbi:hypothetical protein C8A03DRAFT_19646 [Achaetomium macrosporum]|uniref:HIT-type domain-containing protein n=1 Tax=Achaetomium macrosporum TaxID=79813 RepID=A0AAN7H9S9_9PEZI|nr:hypothetical protein C8A03DRAFT_19646 [Achaetomium macrosporum]